MSIRLPRIKMGIARQEALAGYLFIAPAFLVFVVFVAGPMLAAFGFSLYKWDVFRAATFLGLDNYHRLFNDKRFFITFWNTIVYTLLEVPLNLLVALAIAMLINRRLHPALRYFLRTTYFFPVIISFVAVSILWRYLLISDPTFGLINFYFAKLGISPVPWTTSSRWVLRSIVLVNIWKTFGFNLVIFLAGLQNIPRHFYEAAEIDGANFGQKFWHITIPLLTPTIFFALVIEMLHAVQLFDTAFVLTQGGPGDASRPIVMYMYETGFQVFKMGYASAVAVMLFVVVMLLTLLQMRVSRAWVYYMGE
ncbi:MAG: sugar ABC transporter permease [Caldilineaceae bacterium]|nr:sugar ABC transporter permease [Caldilineaceae bacterium]MDE0311406.1 sugar ABC transporter permease [Caldilineaceae bacterium]